LADLTKVSGVANADIEKIDGVAVADIEKIAGVDMPSGITLTTWCAVSRDGHVATMTSSLNCTDDGTGAGACGVGTWSEYTQPDTSSDYTNIAFGQDGSGGALFVATRNAAGGEIAYSADPTVAGSFTIVNVAFTELNCGDWGNNKWILMGNMANKKLATGSNGASWGEVDLSGVDGISTTDVTAIATNGDGTWIFGQADRIYSSTNDGAAWALAHDFDDGRLIKDLAHTKDTGSNSVFAMAYNTGASNDGHAARAKASDLTSWHSTADQGLAEIGGNLEDIGGGGGTFIAGNANDIYRSTDAGDTWSKDNNALPQTNLESLETDGSGFWLAGHRAGWIVYSKDDGDLWYNAKDTGGERWPGMSVNVTTKDKA
jgi:hypothetical protein